jgi:hypothetical protein
LTKAFPRVKLLFHKDKVTLSRKQLNVGYYLDQQLNIYRVEQTRRMFFKGLLLGNGGVDDVGREPADSSENAVSVAMAHWNVEHRVFAVVQFF